MAGPMDATVSFKRCNGFANDAAGDHGSGESARDTRISIMIRRICQYSQVIRADALEKSGLLIPFVFKDDCRPSARLPLVEFAALGLAEASERGAALFYNRGGYLAGCPAGWCRRPRRERKDVQIG